MAADGSGRHGISAAPLGVSGSIRTLPSRQLTRSMLRATIRLRRAPPPSTQSNTMVSGRSPPSLIAPSSASGWGAPDRRRVRGRISPRDGDSGMRELPAGGGDEGAQFLHERGELRREERLLAVGERLLRIAVDLDQEPVRPAGGR